MGGYGHYTITGINYIIHTWGMGDGGCGRWDGECGEPEK